VTDILGIQQELETKLNDSEKALAVIHGDLEALHTRSEQAVREELSRLRKEEERGN
jgi:hypothetical protein